jgi:hypothetical protein
MDKSITIPIKVTEEDIQRICDYIVATISKELKECVDKTLEEMIKGTDDKEPKGILSEMESNL